MKKVMSIIVATVLASQLLPSVNSVATEKEQEIITDNPQQLIDYYGETTNNLFVSDNAISSYDKNYNLTNSGDIHNLVVFIRFSDQNENSVYSSINNSGNGSIEEIKEGFNGDKYSLYDYTKEISSDKFSVTSEFYPQDSNGNTITYVDSHPLSYYESKTDSDNRKTNLMINALNSVASQVSDKQKYDYNNDGILDYVTFVVPNMGNWGEALWPTCITYYSPITISNLGINMRKAIFITTPYFKYYGKSSDMYKVIAHESMHMIGMNDLYNNSDDSVLGNWSVMVGNNGHPTVYEKSEYGKWATNIKDASKSGNYILSNTTKDSKTNTIGYKISLEGSKEYYMLEYRNQNSSIYEKGIEGSGLLVYKVNEDVKGNLDGAPYEVQVIKTSTNARYLNDTYGKYNLSLSGTSGTENYVISLNTINEDELSINVNSTVKTEEKIAINNLSSSLVSPQNVGTQIKFVADTSGQNLKYRYIFKNGTITNISPISTNNYINWTPKNSGTWTVTVQVTDGSKVISKSIKYVVNGNSNEMKINKINSSIASPQKVGTKIKFSVDAEGTSLKYRYIFKNGNITNISSASTNNYIDWTPKSKGTWTVTAQITDGKKVISKSIQYVISDDSSSEIKINSLVSNVASPQLVKTPIKFTVDAEGVSLKYRFIFKNNTTTKITNVLSSNYYTWTPESAGNWSVIAQVTDGNKVISKSIQYVINENNYEKLQLTSITSDKFSPQNINTKITFYAGANGGSKDYTYKYVITNGNTTLSSDYLKSNGIIWTPATAGIWNITAYVKDSDGNVSSKSIEYTINNIYKPLTISDVSIPNLMYTGSYYSITTSAQGTGTLRYKYTFDNGTETMKTEYSTLNGVKVKFATSGYWYVLVEVTDDNGSTASMVKMIYVN